MAKSLSELLEDKARAQAKVERELQLQAQGQGDNMALFFAREELRDVEFHLRTLRPGHIRAPRSVGGADPAVDRQQYVNWLHEDGEEIPGDRDALYQVVRGYREHLTARQAEVFALWIAGHRQVDIATQLGVERSTVQRILTSAKKRLRKQLDLAVQLSPPGAAAASIDLRSGDAAAAIMSVVTPKQAVCLYLHYGEGLSFRAAARLLGIDPSAIVRATQRGLENISESLGYQRVRLDHMDALGELAYTLYEEHYELPEDLQVSKKRAGWARATLREEHPPRQPPPPREITVDVMKESPEKPGRLLAALRCRAEEGGIYRHLLHLFRRIKQKYHHKGDKNAQVKKIRGGNTGWP